ncbi:hypothetical protein ADEAN_000529300 [Angomonas deanei]|uniref:Uncharacterized protein n=1 Tax=Angomonas deanei TaxID=59799 RepID=A0A7G2CDA5_9TRYP|nr:hypothetical protein ADEAN_000529300 [Angomonas deanei]
MGQSLNPLKTHEDVPEDVRDQILPIDYTPVSDDMKESGKEMCEDCGNYYGWFVYSTNCNWCGRQLCTRCCPNRYLLKDKPGCGECTRKAYQMRRNQMLKEHYRQTGMNPKPTHAEAS